MLANRARTPEPAFAASAASSATGTRACATPCRSAITIDEAASEGGDDAGPNPHDLYDAALGACKALTVLWYANRKGIALHDIEVVVDRDASDERKGVYRLKTALRLTGDLSEAQRAELLKVAAKCPVHKLMTDVKTEIETVLL